MRHHPTRATAGAARCACWGVAFSTGLLAAAGCASRGRDWFPNAPVRSQELQGGLVGLLYDVDGDGRGDYREELEPSGRVARLAYDLDHDGILEFRVDRPTGPQAAAAGGERAAGTAPGVTPRRHLLVIVDSVPFEMVRALWDQGRFRLFHQPRRVISTFPVMTDPALAEFFHVSPIPGAEAMCFDGRRLNSGLEAYLSERNNARWLARVDYHLKAVGHGPAYLWPGTLFDKELANIKAGFERSQSAGFVGYCVGTSGLGARRGRSGHQVGLVRLDRFFQRLMYEQRGEIEITLMSDHGHNLLPGKRLDLRRFVRLAGYRVGDRLRTPQDVVIPQFGPVTCAAIYTHSAAAVARDVLGLEGVELCAYLEGDEVVILGRGAKARVRRNGTRYAYRAEFGDPLRMEAVLARLAVDADGFVDDRELFAATVDHEYPDALHRLWRAFHGLFEHPPQVLLSLEEGWFVGSPDFDVWLDLAAAHGNLHALGSTAFVMTTLGELPHVMRIEDLAAGLRAIGAPLASP